MLRACIALVAFALLTAAAPSPAPPPPSTELPTPMSERVVRLGVLNKHNRDVRTIIAKPGATVGLGRLLIRVRACEATPPYERPLSGAFLQIDERLRQGGVKRVFSGWLFAQSPSLNSFQHPIYDVWVRSCTMRFPETGPETIILDRSGSSARPSASKSDAAANAEANARR